MGMYVGFLGMWADLHALGRNRAQGMPPRLIWLTLVLCVGVMGADGVNAFLYDFVLRLYAPRLEWRLATGWLTGIAFAGILLPVVKHSLWRAHDPRLIVANGRQWLGGMLVLAGLYLLNDSRLGILFYPLAIVACASVLALVRLINSVPTFAKKDLP